MAAEIVDRVVVDLQARVKKYVADMDASTKAHQRWKAEVLSGSAATDTATQTSAGRQSAARKRSATAAGQEAAAVTAASRATAAAQETTAASAERTSARRQTASKAAAAAEKTSQVSVVRGFAALATAAEAAAAAEIAAQERIARAVEAGAARRAAALRRGTGAFATSAYAVQPGERSAIPVSPIRAAVPEESAVNHLLRDRIDIETRLLGAKGRQRVALRDQATELRLIQQYQRAGLSEAEAIARAERGINALRAQRIALARQERAINILNATASGVAGIARPIAGAAVVGTLALTASAAVAVSYARDLKAASDQLEITTRDLQVYQEMAREVGVSNDQLRSSFSQFANVLGQAKEGSREYLQIFRALGIDVRNFASAGDALPTVIDRISQIADPAHRAAVETRLFGESGRRLDSLLSGGVDRLNEFADGMERNGRVLSEQDVGKLNDLSRALGAIKQQLMTDISQVVADNAGAILSLAQSFGWLATKIIEAAAALGRFRAQNVYRTTGDRQERAEARTALLQSPEGRAFLRSDNTRRIGELRNIDTRGDPAAVQAQQQRERALLLERREILRAGNAPPPAPTPTVQPGSVNPALLANLRAPSGPRGPSAETLERQAQARERNFQRRLEGYEEDRLSALREQVVGDQERRAFDERSIQRGLKREIAEIDREVNDKRIDAHRRDQLVAAAKAAAAEQQRVLLLEENVQAIEAMNQLTQAGFEHVRGLLQDEAALATTREERLRIALQLLAIEKEALRQRLQAVVGSPDPNVSNQDRGAAADALGRIDSTFASRESVVRNQNLSPRESYLQELERASAEMNDALDRIAIDGFDRLNDSIVDVIMGTKSLGDAFKSMANQIISDLLRIAIQQAIIGPIAGALFGGGGVSSLFGGFRAGGGPVQAGKAYVVGEKRAEVFVPNQSGTIIPDVRAVGGSAANARPHITVISAPQFDLRNMVGTPELFREVQRISQANATRAGAAAAQGALKAAPGRMGQFARDGR